jgi:transcriptional regulator GlxA family with amidase domain
MKHVSVLIPKGQYSIVNLGGAYQLLNWANDVFFQQTRTQLFQIEFVGHESPAKDAWGFYTITPPKTIDQIKKTDLIIVPAVHGDIDEAIAMNRNVMQWVKKQHEGGAEVAAFCIGAFLLADAGMLNGKTCSTHWGEAPNLAKRFPEVTVEPENIVAECGGIYTSGGAYAFTNLVIYLIERYGGRELAILTAKAFMIDVDKNNQSLFMIFNGQKDHKDELAMNVQTFIEENYQQKLSLEQMASEHATIRRTLERRFKKATGNSVNEYVQRVRVEAAKRLLEREMTNVNQAMYDVGYNDPKAFREVFKKYVGVSPMDYKRKFSVALN